MIKDAASKSDEYWKERLSSEQYRVVREHGTEPPFTGAYLDNKDKGVYRCVACGQELFDSSTKFESGTGWPSFYEAVDASNVNFKDDYSLGHHRVEVSCSNCGAHLGHVFPDGPQPTGQRYCINSVALDFRSD